MALTVKAVADLAGITVRTLHHYDHIGLLKPSATSPSGYRLYSDGDLERLQQILFFRELDIGLTEIRRILDDPGFDRKKALREHRNRLLARQGRIAALLRTIDRTLASLEGGSAMTREQLFEGFDDRQYREEAEKRWGKDVVATSYDRLAKLSKQERDDVWAEAQAIASGVAALMDCDPADPEVQKLVARHYRWVNFFWDCDLRSYRELGRMYVEDPRFAANYDKIRPGLAVFMRDAIQVYADASDCGSAPVLRPTT